MIKLGIIGAMQEEIETLLGLMENKTEKEIAGSVFHQGLLEGLPVTVVQCGIGKVNAALCAQILTWWSARTPCITIWTPPPLVIPWARCPRWT